MGEVVSHLLTLLVGGVIGVVIGGLGKVAQDSYSRHHDTRVMAAALRAEILVILDGIRRGQYIGMCDKIVAHVSVPGHVVTPDDYLDAPVTQTLCPIFNAHCSKIGLLGDAAGAVVRTYELWESVALDLRFLPDRHKRLPLNAKQLVAFHQGMKGTFEQIIENGERAAELLRQEQQIRWARRWRRTRGIDEVSG